MLSLLQIALLFAAPVSACCARDTGALGASASADVECCPPGSHPPGQCPFHKSRAGTSEQSTKCRVRCDAQRPMDLLLATTGVLPRPFPQFLPASPSSFDEWPAAVVPSRRGLPDAPPPKSL